MGKYRAKTRRTSKTRKGFMKKKEVDSVGCENVVEVKSVDHPGNTSNNTTTSFSTVAEDTPSSSTGTTI